MIFQSAVRKGLFVCGVLCAVLSMSAAGACSTRIDLNEDWHFRVDPSKAGMQTGWSNALPAQTEEVSLPHTWNIGEHYRYEGDAWYFKTFARDPALQTRRIEIHFGATFYASRVWLNGHLLGEHEGGFTEYYFDATPYLKDVNFLAVEINNEPKVDTIPGIPLKSGPESTIYDWWPYGGIIRGVWLTAGDETVLRWQHIDATPSNGDAEIRDNLRVENHGTRTQDVLVRLAAHSLTDSADEATVEKWVQIAPGSQDVSLSLTLKHAHLWDFDHPYLYRMDASLQSRDGKQSDSIRDNFGVRTVTIRDRKLYLNEARVRLSGLSRHEDSPWEGTAETRGTIKHDYDDLKNLQTTLARPVHYPQHPLIYDYADKNGILMIPEIPMWQFSEKQMRDPKVIALAKREMQELIEQNYNHPSIFAWSVDNESATNTPGGIEYFKTMYPFVKQLDPRRFVSFADDMIAFVNDPATNASSLADFIMWNEYFGSWDGPESMLPPALDRIEKGYPGKMVIVSEFGTPGIYATSTQAADVVRVEIIHKQLALFAQRDWIAGALFWCYQDYHSFHNLRPGQQDDFVDHGLVDKNRQRRPSYYAWQMENSPAHIEVKWRYDDKGTPVGFTAGIRRRAENELPSYDLKNYRVEWVVLDQNGKKIAGSEQELTAVGPPQEIIAKWAASDAKVLHFEMRLYRPTGFLAMKKNIVWRTPELGLDDGDNPE
ncbi:MAG TPA: glycoside hydrolase family 2 TIM barrel-domain containing protein [Acidisarcina sp.]|nr:glycoside hydrolase family 2 TIM barrel-domain containing protein [Acidisarcina sp.]